MDILKLLISDSLNKGYKKMKRHILFAVLPSIWLLVINYFYANYFTNFLCRDTSWLRT